MEAKATGTMAPMIEQESLRQANGTTAPMVEQVSLKQTTLLMFPTSTAI